MAIPAADPKPEDLCRWLNRATFGVTPALQEEAMQLGWERWVSEQLKPEEKEDEDCRRRLQKFRLHIEYEIQPVMKPAEKGGTEEKAKPDAPPAKMMMATKAKKVKEDRPLKL